MLALERIAEQRIAEAIERGELDRLPGAGCPLVLDDDSMIPAELRAGYRVLKNAGYVPEEVRLHRDIASIEAALVDAGLEGRERRRALCRLDMLRARLAARRGGRECLALHGEYARKLVEALER